MVCRRCIKQVIQRVKDEGADVMIASHNQHSVEQAVALMHELDINPTSSGQLRAFIVRLPNLYKCWMWSTMD